MTLGSVIESLLDLVEVAVIVVDYDTIYGVYTKREHINVYQNYKVKQISTTDNGILIIVVDGNTED